MCFVGYGDRFGVKAYCLYDANGRLFHFSRRSVIFHEGSLLSGRTTTTPDELTVMSPPRQESTYYFREHTPIQQVVPPVNQPPMQTHTQSALPPTPHVAISHATHRRMQRITGRRPHISEVPVRLVDLFPSTTHVASDGSMQTIPPVDHASHHPFPSSLSPEPSANPAYPDATSSFSQPASPTDPLLSDQSPVAGPDPAEVHADSATTPSPSSQTRVRSLRDIYSRLNLAAAGDSLAPDYSGSLLEDDNISVEEALSGPDALHWRHAMDAEYQALLQNSTWSLVDLPSTRCAVSCKWILRCKLKADGSLDRYKARLVARGFSQSPGLDYEETFSLVLGMASFRMLVATAAHYDWPLHQLDIKTAFLHGELEEEIYMQQPPFYQEADAPHKVCRLHKALYGLKQSPRQWYLKIHQFLLSVGYSRLQTDPNIYTRHVGATYLILGLYVDDILFPGSHLHVLQSTKQQLAYAFSFTDGGELSYCLSIQVNRDHSKGIITLSQAKFVAEILHKYNMAECNGTPIPLAPNNKLTTSTVLSTQEEKQYMASVPFCNVLGSIRYLVTCTRPDVCLFLSGFSLTLYAESRHTALKGFEEAAEVLEGNATLYYHIQAIHRYATNNIWMDGC